MGIDAFATATAMLAALRARRVSAVELLDLHRRRIERHNPRLTAIVEPDFERARGAAEAADLRLARGRGGPAARTAHDAEGVDQRAGAAHHRRHGAVGELPLRARRAGDDPRAGRGRRHHGQDQRPAHARRLAVEQSRVRPGQQPLGPGTYARGSTGGGAAALAAGLTPLEYGSDIGGSIRVPAAFCGVYGHRPSETVMPRSGQFPIPPMPNAAVVMGVQGPLARSAEDLELALDVAAGPEVGEDVGWKLSIPPARHDAPGPVPGGGAAAGRLGADG